MRPTPAAVIPESDATTSAGQKLVNFLVRRRVRISVIVFLILILEDVLIGIRPHDVFSIGDAYSMIGLGLFLAGLALRSWAAGTLRKNNELTTNGPYDIIRNPLYVGSLMMMLGICVLIDDPENIWLVLGPVAAMYALGVRREERHLSARFGEQWQAYARSTPRFIPRRWPKDGFRSGSWNQWLNNREYRAVCAGLLGLLALALWQRF